jgi:hypothetical protein
MEKLFLYQPERYTMPLTLGARQQSKMQRKRLVFILLFML